MQHIQCIHLYTLRKCIQQRMLTEPAGTRMHKVVYLMYTFDMVCIHLYTYMRKRFHYSNLTSASKVYIASTTFLISSGSR